MLGCDPGVGGALIIGYDACLGGNVWVVQGGLEEMGSRNRWRGGARGKRVRCDEKDDPEQWSTLRRETSLNQGTTGWSFFCLVCFQEASERLFLVALSDVLVYFGFLVVVIEEFFSRDINLNHDRMKCEELDKVTYQSVCFVDNLRTPTTNPNHESVPKRLNQSIVIIITPREDPGNSGTTGEETPFGNKGPLSARAFAVGRFLRVMVQHARSSSDGWNEAESLTSSTRHHLLTFNIIFLLDLDKTIRENNIATNSLKR